MDEDASCNGIENCGSAGSAAVPSSGGICRLKTLLLCRIFAGILTLCAAFSMCVARQTETITNFRINVNSFQSSSFVFFIIVNAIVCMYSTILSQFYNLRKYSISQPQLPNAIADLVVVIALFTGNSISVVTEELAWNGNLHFGWEKFCNVATRFCIRATTAIVLSLLAAACYFVIMLLSIFAIHKSIRY